MWNSQCWTWSKKRRKGTHMCSTVSLSTMVSCCAFGLYKLKTLSKRIHSGSQWPHCTSTTIILLAGTNVCEKSRVSKPCASQPGVTFLSESNSFTLRLKTDDSTEGPGFLMRYSSSKCLYFQWKPETVQLYPNSDIELVRKILLADQIHKRSTTSGCFLFALSIIFQKLMETIVYRTLVPTESAQTDILLTNVNAIQGILEPIVRLNSKNVEY